jgi:hypothetical protein
MQIQTVVEQRRKRQGSRRLPGGGVEAKLLAAEAWWPTVCSVFLFSPLCFSLFSASSSLFFSFSFFPLFCSLSLSLSLFFFVLFSLSVSSPFFLP